MVVNVKVNINYTQECYRVNVFLETNLVRKSNIKKLHGFNEHNYITGGGKNVTTIFCNDAGSHVFAGSVQHER